MFAAAEAMEFERAAAIRDRIGQMRDQIGKPVAAVRESGSREAASGAGEEEDGRSGAVERPRAAAEENYLRS